MWCKMYNSQAHSAYLEVEEEALKIAKEMWAVSSKTGKYLQYI